jgi:predicted transcriptional regulator
MARKSTTAEKDKTVGVGVRLRPAVKDELVRIAQEERRTVSQTAAIAIEDWLDRRKKVKT